MSAPNIARWTATSRRRWSLALTMFAATATGLGACTAAAGVQRTAVERTPAPVVQNDSRPSPPAPAKTAKPAGPLRVEIWGDSLVQQTADYLRFFFQVSGKVTLTVHAFGGTAICDWLPDMRKELSSSDPTAFHPQVAVLAFNGDTGTPCMSDLAGNQLLGQTLVQKYLDDSAKAVDLFTRAKVPVYFVTDPLDSVTNFVYVDFTQIGQLFEQMPKRHPAGGLVRWIDAASPLELDGHFTFTLPCQPWETCTGTWPDGTKTVVVRQADGMHFCPVTQLLDASGHGYCPTTMPGATRYAMAISEPVLRDLRLAGGRPLDLAG